MLRNGGNRHHAEEENGAANSAGGANAAAGTANSLEPKVKVVPSKRMLRQMRHREFPGELEEFITTSSQHPWNELQRHLQIDPKAKSLPIAPNQRPPGVLCKKRWKSKYRLWACYKTVSGSFVRRNLSYNVF